VEASGILRRTISEVESTTPDLMELQKRLTDAANRRDLDATMAFYAPDGVYDMSPIGMGVFEGQAAARGFIEDWWGSYEQYEFEAEETLDLGNGLAFACSFRRAVQWAAAARLSCATQPSACGRTARSCA
jgi:ketosteroid isomerase-like protein